VELDMKPEDSLPCAQEPPS